MKEYNLNGIKFNVGDGENGDFSMFTEGDPRATDNAPWGMVEEMKTFIRLQDKYGWRHFVDVGALWGVFSLVFTRHEDANAYAIEPSDSAFQGLLENASLNPIRNIKPIHAFAGDEEGELVPCGVEWKHVTANRKGDDGTLKLAYPQRRLDKMTEIEACDVIKIDVEGFEGPVLRGAENLIGRLRPVIFLEAHFSVLPQVSMDTNETLFKLITDEMQYTPFTFQGNEAESFEGLTGYRFILFPN